MRIDGSNPSGSAAQERMEELGRRRGDGDSELDLGRQQGIQSDQGDACDGYVSSDDFVLPYQQGFEGLRDWWCSDNSIYLIEAFSPPKADVLNYIDGNGDIPERYAKVAILLVTHVRLVNLHLC